MLDADVDEPVPDSALVASLFVDPAESVDAPSRDAPSGEPPSLDPPSGEPPSPDPPSPDPPSADEPEPDLARVPVVDDRSFFAHPEPLKWTAGDTSALRIVASAPHAGQNRGPAALMPWITSIRCRQEAQT